MISLDEERARVYEAIGRAISAWGGLEIALARLYSILLVERDMFDGALITFFSIENFRSKLQLVDILAKSRLAIEEDRERWTSAEKHVRARQKKRNRLAHHDIFVKDKEKELRRVLVVPPFLNPVARARVEHREEVPMHLADIETAIKEFADTAREVHALANDLLIPRHLRKLGQQKV